MRKETSVSEPRIGEYGDKKEDGPATLSSFRKVVCEVVQDTSLNSFVEKLIKSELGEITGLCPNEDLGIERVHRALAPQPPVGAPPRSIVIRFQKFTVKEKILHAAWKKKISMQDRRVYFDHDYAENVQWKRREYTPIKKLLKEKKIRFQTPLTKMRVHFDSGTVTYNSAEEAVADLESGDSQWDLSR
ncbi:hypothetical protein LDENG_00227690 [Lucifuga dentata]|nr:hypothetical protein LDENG_00227690 [Lucifuga dentata]